MQHLLPNFIDLRNSDLWQTVSSVYQIQLKPSLNGEYSIYTQNKNATIFVTNDCSIESFTHELLHLYLDVKEVLVGPCLNLSRLGNPKLLQILSEQLVEHLGNCLNHIKMLPLYLERGFPREKFILDYDQPKCSENDINLSKLLLRSGASYRAIAIDNIIGKFMAIKADPNTSFDYSDALLSLEEIDSPLFIVLNNFYDDWLRLNIEKYDLFHNYRTIVNSFYDQLNAWASDKQFI